jgi:hypothetical protein
MSEHSSDGYKEWPRGYKIIPTHCSLKRTVVLILEKNKFRLLLHSLMVIVFLLLLNSRFEFLYYISFYIHD